MNAHQIEAIAQADAYANNAALPTYSELLSALEEMYAAFGNCGSPRQQKAADAVQGVLAKAGRVEDDVEELDGSFFEHAVLTRPDESIIDSISRASTARKA
ncbi:hypothetical protein [Aromatoleum evansii]|uniref:hypothetical protein n=1 Tax=Aromatoleum evansii TaxID=59406 RepID=UPI00145D9DE8|nr:hypothetical protein [Aromatoleum evansii]NMG29581.1 hypothetical protein [Aromatoleum evansii]